MLTCQLQHLLCVKRYCNNRGYYTVVRRYGFYLRVMKTIFYEWAYRPFRLMRVITHAHVSTRANQSTRAICCTHEKSYSAEKVLFHTIFFFQSFVFVYERHLWIMQYMSIAYRRRWLWRPEHRPKRKVGFIRLFCVGFQFRFFFRTAQAYTVYYFKC